MQNQVITNQINEMNVQKQMMINNQFHNFKHNQKIEDEYEDIYDYIEEDKKNYIF